jgi:hypothetical protein
MSVTVEGRELGFHDGAQMGLRLALDAILGLVVNWWHELCDLIHTGSKRSHTGAIPNTEVT